MAALDLLGQRWMLRIIWELRDEAVGFRELKRRTDDISSSALARRLSGLRESGIVETNDDGAYELTTLGLGLGPALGPLWFWADEWSAAMSRRV